MPSLITDQDGTVLLVSVDYSNSLYQMIDSIRLRWVHPDIRPLRFPIVGSGKVIIRVGFYETDQCISGAEALSEIRNSGRRPARLEELLALAFQHPMIVWPTPIVACGTIGSINGRQYIPTWKEERPWGQNSFQQILLTPFDEVCREPARFVFAM